MSRMDLESLWHDRRPPLPEPVEVPEGVEQAPEVEVIPEQMGEDSIIDSIRVPSANPGPGTMMMGRQRDRDLCRHCGMPLISHGAGSYEHHAPERMTGGQRTPGVHADVEDGRARSTQPSAIRSTARYGD